MKTACFASILALVAVTALACNDDEDRVNDGPDRGGSASQAGSPGAAAGAAGNDLGGADGVGGQGGAVGAAAGSDFGGGAGTSIGGEGGDAGETTVGGGSASGDAGAGGSGEGGTGGAPAEPFELIGEYDNDFGGEELISADKWNASAIAAYDNDDNVVYLLLPPDDQYNANKFTKVVYTEPAGGSFFYCWVAFGFSTLAEAQASAATADATDPTTSGCGGFSWTRATAP